MITHVQAMRRALSETFPKEDVFKAFTDQEVIDNMVFVSPRTWTALADHRGQQTHMIVMVRKCPFVIHHLHYHDFHSYFIACSQDMSQDHHCHQYHHAS